MESTSECYTVPTVIDIATLGLNSLERSLIIQEIGKACREMGFFQVVNHGICPWIMENAIKTALEFFDLPVEEKKEFMSDDIYKPVRFGSSPLRDFIKLYSHPLEDWIGSWPSNPSNYRDNMGKYTKEVRRLGNEILGAIMESLELDPTYMKYKIEEGMHIMAINSYPSCSKQDPHVFGIPPHTDHSIITLLLQNCSGFQIMNSKNGDWKTVPELHGSLQVLVGDHLEVLSNGLYKSVLHRAVPSLEKTRLSLASLHSLAMDEIVEPVKEMVDEEHPRGYKGSSVRDFLKFLSSKEKRTFIETLKIV